MDNINPPIITVILGPILFCNVPPMVPPMPNKASRSENVRAASAFEPQIYLKLSHFETHSKYMPSPGTIGSQWPQ